MVGEGKPAGKHESRDRLSMVPGWDPLRLGACSVLLVSRSSMPGATFCLITPLRILQVVDREAEKEQPEGMETPAVYAGPYILHYDKTHLDAVGNYIMAPLYMSLGNYSRKFIGKARKGYVLVALLPIPKPEAFALGWTKDSTEFK